MNVKIKVKVKVKIKIKEIKKYFARNTQSVPGIF